MMLRTSKFVPVRRLHQLRSQHHLNQKLCPSLEKEDALHLPDLLCDSAFPRSTPSDLCQLWSERPHIFGAKIDPANLEAIEKCGLVEPDEIPVRVSLHPT